MKRSCSMEEISVVLLSLFFDTVITCLLHACQVASVVSDSVTHSLWTVAHHTPLSMGFSRQEYWSGLPCPSLGDLPDPGIELTSLMSPALAGRFFTTSAAWEAQINR